MTGSSTEGIKTVVYAALLGVPPQTDGSYYVGFEVEGQHIGLVPGGGPPPRPCRARWQRPRAASGPMSAGNREARPA
jgi:hypothetical protein